MIAQYFNNRRVLAVLLMGFSSGLPLALTGTTLQAWFTEANVSILAIGALTLVGLPYTFKFLWSPLLDRFVPPFLGRRRGWLIIAQLGLALTLFVLTFFNPVINAEWMGCLALFIAFLSASQDIAYDAYRTDVLLPKERGLGAAAVTLGYRLAMLTSGGLALVLADHLGWALTYRLMAVVMLGLSVVTFFAPEPSLKVIPPASFKAAIIEPFKNFLKRDRVLLIVLFIFLYKIGDALALSLMSNFLLRSLTFSLTEVGLAFKTLGLTATILGAVIGGNLLSRMSLFQALLCFGLCQAFSNLMFMILAIVGKSYGLMLSSVFIEQFCSGLSTAALVTFLMSLCDARYTATQYALLSAIAACGRVFLGPLAAILVEQLGWISFFGWATLASFPGLLLLILLRSEMRSNAEVMV